MRSYSSKFIRFQEIIQSDDYVILDTETSSLDGEVLEVAVIDSSGVVLLNTLVKPSAGCYINPQASRVHGITYEMLADAPNWNTVRKQLIDVVRYPYVVIYNADFDTKIIRNTDTAHGLKPCKYTTRGAWCAMKYTAEFIGDWKESKRSYQWHTLSSVATRFKIETPNAHRALGDCQTTLAVIKHIQFNH